MLAVASDPDRPGDHAAAVRGSRSRRGGRRPAAARCPAAPRQWHQDDGGQRAHEQRTSATRGPGAPGSRRAAPRGDALGLCRRAPSARSRCEGSYSGVTDAAFPSGAPRTCAQLGCRSHVREGPGRQPRRDRDPRRPRAATSWASRPSRSTPRSTATRSTSRAPTRRTCSAGRPAAESYLNVEKILEVVPRVRRRGGPSRLRLPGRERRASPRRCEDAGIVFIGPPAQRDRGDGLQDPRPRADAGRRRADRAGHDRAVADRRGRVAGSSPPTSATRWRSRPRAAAAARASASRWTSPSSRRPSRAPPREGEKFFSDATRLPRALPARPAPRRGPGPRRPPRQRHPPRRARLLGPAPPPEGHRGVAGAGRRRGAARADRQDRRRRRAGRRLRRRGDDRGPAPGRRVLLPRDEHPRPGRALRDRDGRPASTSSARASAPRPASS